VVKSPSALYPPLILHTFPLLSVSSAVAVFVTVAFLFTFLVFDSNPLSPDTGAKAHGRADAVFLTCTVLLVVLVEVWPHLASPWLLAVACLVAGVAWSSAYLVLLPYYNHSM
jgi:hypothetical protein